MNPNTSNSKQIVLQGHSRPIKFLKFSESGYSIFSASNDRNVIEWNSNTGEKIKTFPHSAAINNITLTKKNNYMLTGDNTGCVYLWDIQGGVLLKQIEQNPSLCVRSIDLSTDDSLLLILYAGRAKDAKSFINVYKMQDILDFQGEESKEEKKGNYTEGSFSNFSGLMKQTTINKIQKPIVIGENTTSVLPFKTFVCSTPSTKYMQAKFAVMNKSILVSREDGNLELINFHTGKIITESKFHTDIILDFDFNSEKSLILTASRDGSACVINFDTFQMINKFLPQNPTRNLNACTLAVIQNPEYINGIGSENKTISSINDVNLLFDTSSKQPELLKLDIDNIFGTDDGQNFLKVTKIKKEFVVAILSGGQDSKLVTTTNKKEGGFEIIIYDAIDGNEMANFLTHFGPVNTLEVHNNLLASGAEDATVRIYKMDNYLFPIDKNK